MYNYPEIFAVRRGQKAGAEKGRGMSGGLRRNRNTGPGRSTGPGYGKGGSRGQGKNR